MKESHQSRLISEKLSPQFIKDFIDYWEKIEEILRLEGKNLVSWREWNEIAKKMLPNLTKPFYEKWKRLKIISLVEQYTEKFSSFVFYFRGGSILIPRQLIIYRTSRPSHNLLKDIKNNPSIEEFEKVMFTLCADLNVKLRKSDFKVLQKLSQPRFSKSLTRFPKLKELAYGIRKDIRTVSSSLNYLIQHQVLSTIYLVDIARIGYQTMLIFHNRKKPEMSKDIQPYISLSFPVTTQGGFSTVLQYPYRNTASYDKLMNFFDSEDRIQMNFLFCGWNFGGLTRKSEKRWILLPPLLEESGKWSTQLILGETGLEFNLDPLYDPYPLSYRQGRLLDLVHKHSTMTEDMLAKELQLSRTYITEDFKNLLRNHIILRYPIFSNLGLTSKVYFCIRGLTTLNHGGLKNIIEHLKFFPYVKVFYNLEEGTLIGKVNIPALWINAFIFRLTSLPELYPKCSYYYYIGPEVYDPWAFDILGTFDWDNHS